MAFVPVVPLFALFGLAPSLLSEVAKPVSTHTSSAAQANPGSHWLFAGFKSDSKDGVYYAISLDGDHWKLAFVGKPIIPPTAPMRDPFIQRAPAGSFRMVWTWAWYDPQNIGYSESKDLLIRTRHRELPVMAGQPGARNLWAPALYFEPAQKRWLIFWASTIPGCFAGDDSGDGGLNHRIFSTTTADFQTFTSAKVFFDPACRVIDATELPPSFTLIFKDERKTPLEKHLLTATGPTAEGPSNISEPLSETWSEGAVILPVRASTDSPTGYLAYYDYYSQGQNYGAVFLNRPRLLVRCAVQDRLPRGHAPRLLCPDYPGRVPTPRRTNTGGLRAADGVKMIHEVFPVGILQCNCSILGDEASHEAIVVDPGDDIPRILAILARHKLTVKQILITHAHIDHIAGAALLKAATGAPILYNKLDLPLVKMMDVQAGWLGMETPDVLPPDDTLEDGRVIAITGITGNILHTPGHTQGSVCLYIPEKHLLLAGDTLFAGSVGRTDLPGGDSHTLLRSIHDKLLPLPDATMVIPGHGPRTTIGAERESNPFLTNRNS